MEPLISILITVLVLGLVFGLCVWIIDMIPLQAPFNMVAKAILGLIFILVLLSQIGILGTPMWHPILR